VLVLISKMMIAVAIAGLLRCSGKFRRMSRRLDEQVYAVLKRIMRATEEAGFPAHTVPVLMLLTFMAFITAAVR
jgi:hypothetical protein